jgi:uncharacterized hydrophobic protein (TIGR00271 family)
LPQWLIEYLGMVMFACDRPGCSRTSGDFTCYLSALFADNELIMKRIIVVIKQTIAHRFSLDDDKGEETLIVASIRRNVEFKGSSLWTLIFAIFIASIGLNVNSAAVVIGAMLISPLMGPIMGIGLGIGINDLELVKNGVKNLLIAAFFSIAASTLYFWLTPLHEAQSEILARTTPSLWDVFIALFGGLAGIIAGTRKEKTNVIPGVAIATALMPPLCTAGFGIANGYIYYFLGALYLFFINSVFICISTFLIVRFLKFHRKEFADSRIEKRVSRTILWLVILTTLPSVYLAYKIVDRSIFESNARKFIATEFNFKRTQVVNQSFTWSNDQKSINLLLIGEELARPVLDTIRHRLNKYNLLNTDLVIKQGLNAKQEIDFSAIKASILRDVFVQTDSSYRGNETADTMPDLGRELAALYPDVISFSLTMTPITYLNTTVRNDSIARDTLMLAVVDFKRSKTRAEAERLRNWIKTRIRTDSVKLIIE